MSRDDFSVVYAGGTKPAPTANQSGFSNLLMYPFSPSNVTLMQPQRQINATDSKVFWIVLYSFPVLWLLLALVAILKFQFFWLTIVGTSSPQIPRACLSLRTLVTVVVALILNMANVLAFTRCDKDQKRKWATGAAVGALSGGTGGFAGRIAGAMMGRFFR